MYEESSEICYKFTINLLIKIYVTFLLIQNTIFGVIAIFGAKYIDIMMAKYFIQYSV